MLTELHIKNFALIDEVRINPHEGFNVLTGETGAGKSIIVDALGAVIGARTGSDVVRTGEEKCFIQAVFDIAGNNTTVDNLQRFGFDIEDNTLIISREITKQGKSTVRINGQVTTASILKDITASLIDIHGQHEHQSLMNVALHIQILDDWIGSELIPLKKQCQSIYAEIKAQKAHLQSLQTDAKNRNHLIDLYKFQVNEIQNANITPGEEDELSAEKIKLLNTEKLFTAASSIYDSLAQDGGAMDSISIASSNAEKASAYDSQLRAIVENLNTALVSVQEASSAVRDYRESLESDPKRLEQVESRLDLLKTLKKKYGTDEQEIIDYSSSISIQLNELENAESISETLVLDIQKVTNKHLEICNNISALRKEHALKLSKSIESELADLSMGKSKFSVEITQTNPSENGIDGVEFLISPNPGEPLKPLAKIASGGEMSRVGLAIKAAGKVLQVPTLVFDEVDSGIGGRTAQVLGEKLALLAKGCQIFCVTHLPQVASLALSHYVVEKVVNNGRSAVVVTNIAQDSRISEIARMLGDESSTSALLHAKEMLNRAL